MNPMMNTASILLLALLLVLVNESNGAVVVQKPKVIVLQTVKDPLTRQYVTTVHQRTPLVAVKLSVDLTGGSLWVDCDTGYNSSSYRRVGCGSANCVLARSNACDRFRDNKRCLTTPANPFKPSFYSGGVASEDVLSLRYTTGEVAISPKFVFNCGPDWFSDSLAGGAKGMVGLGAGGIALPNQLSRTFGFRRRFLVCLSSTTGALYFGDFPTNIPGPQIRTPLIKNPIGTTLYGRHEFYEYYIGVKSIKVNGEPVSMNYTMLSTFNEDGDGGTKLSSIEPYTVLKSPIFAAVIRSFRRALPRSSKLAAPVAPFGLCVKSDTPVSSLPSVDLVLQGYGGKVAGEWRISGEKLMVKVGKDLRCLGFVEYQKNFQDGAAIVIGANQIEDTLLEFNLHTSSLSIRQTSCANFKL